MLISNSILAFKTGQNALLESPTGTGKSLALLSAALSYLETSPQITKLYYTSRTHIQLQQLVSEYKKLPYFPQFSILASKKHLCIVPQVSNSNSPEYSCRKLCEEDGCPYVNSNNSNNGDIEDVKIKKQQTTTMNNSVPYEFTNRGSRPKFDINDLKEYGRTHHICPYQLAFNIYHTAQLVFCPYNYILKSNDDKNLLLDFPKDTTIAIFDEGHNIESTAREDASLTLCYKQVEEARRSLQYVPLDDSFKPLFENVQKIQTDILNFIQSKRDEYNRNFESYQVNNRPKYLSAESFRSVFRLSDEKLVSSIGVQMSNWLKLLANSDKESLERDKMYVNDVIVSFFSSTADVFLAITPATFDFYRIVFVPDERGDLNRDEFRLLCLKPSFLFDKINRKTRSIIISSGTLSPLESFAAELESSFPIRVSAPHVVDASQVVTLSINSYQNVRITSRYATIQNRGDEIYSALSHIISRTLKTVPGGSLFFTPSYYSKDAILRQWKSSGMYEKIGDIKPIVEERSNLSANQIIAEFRSFPDGALLVGVCRGKISEGLDFADDLSRIVYVFGIPYPGFKEADVELKMKYNDTRHSLNKSYLSGQEWYNCQAFRALFQSVGRCLRHTNDYGAIVFLDERIEANIEKLPNWLKTNLYKNQAVDQAEKILDEFFRIMKVKFPLSNNLSSLNSNFDLTSKRPNYDFQYQSPKMVKMNQIIDLNDGSFLPSQNSPSRSFYPEQKNSPSQYSPSQNSPSRSFYSEPKNSPYVKIPDDKFSFDSKSSLNMKNEPESNFFNAGGFCQKPEDVKIDHQTDNEFELEREMRAKDDRNKFLTDMFCSSCGSLVIRIKNLDSADFKTIYLPEFFQILNVIEAKTKIMYMMKDAVQSDLTKIGASITAADFSITLTRKECPGCGKPIGVYVANSDENSEFKRGQLLYRQDMLAMEFDGQILSLSDIASNF